MKNSKKNRTNHNTYCPQDGCKLSSRSRRRFLYQSTGALTAPAFISQLQYAHALGSLGRSSSKRHILVMIQLSGGNDGLNTVIPYGDDHYGRNRFSLRIRENNLHKLDQYHGLHPQLNDLHALYQEGDLAIVQGVGYPNPNRSHFASMDIWHTAQTDLKLMQAAKRTSARTGWLGRSYDHINSNKLPVIHLGDDRQPLALIGQRIRIPSIQSINHFQFNLAKDEEYLASINQIAQADRNAPNPLLSFAQQSTITAIDASQEIKKATQRYQSKASYPYTPLANQLNTVAKMIHAGFKTRVYYLTLGGFDTHANQANAHASLMQELGGSISAFLKDIKAHGHQEEVIVATFSEFGRRIKENASRGTDHGVAGPMLIAGDPVKGGLHGEHPSLTNTDEGDLIHHTDFREVYATLLDNWLGMNSSKILGNIWRGLPLIG